jgi:hypothetical protein
VIEDYRNFSLASFEAPRLPSETRLSQEAGGLGPSDEGKRQHDQGADICQADGHELRLHYCRGCGQSLPLGFRGQFHKECLRADKQSRTRQ